MATYRVELCLMKSGSEKINWLVIVLLKKDFDKKQLDGNY